MSKEYYKLKPKDHKTGSKFALLQFFIFILMVGAPGGFASSQAVSSVDACANCYYVDIVHGSDSNPGTQALPWKTIAKAVNTMPEGSTTIVLQGVYPETVSIKRSNLTLIANGQVITKDFYLTGSFNTVYGFEITNPDSNWGIRLEGSGNLIEANNIHHTKQDGIWFFGSDQIIRGNTIHDIMQRPEDPHIDCFQTWGPASNIVFEQNVCHNPNTYGSNQIVMVENINPPVEDLTFKNNIFIMDDPGYSPMNFVRKSGQDVISNITVINNDIIHPNGIGNEGVRLDNITNAVVKNNLFIDYGTKNNPYVSILNSSTNIVIDHNAIYKTDGVAPQGGPYPGDIWMQDPLVVNYSRLDLHLLPGSPLIDKGFNDGALVTNDFDGELRPQGSRFDIGADEQASFEVNFRSWLPLVISR